MRYTSQLRPARTLTEKINRDVHIDPSENSVSREVVRGLTLQPFVIGHLMVSEHHCMDIIHSLIRIIPLYMGN